MTALAHPTHPVTRAVDDVRDQLAGVAGVPLWSMGPNETNSTIAEVLAAEAQLAELKTRLLTHAGEVDLPGGSAASSVANWHAASTRTTKNSAHRAARLAAGLESHDLTRAALAEGRVHVEQAEAILRALAELPTDLDAELVEQAKRRLLQDADQFDAKALKTLGRRILEVIDPETADAHEARLLEREERDAEAATRLTMWDDGHGKTHGRFTVDTLTGAALKKALHALAAPKHRAAKGPLGETKPTPERLGEAFVELIRRYPVKKLPKTGGLNATVVVTMQYDTLLDGLKAAHLDTGDTISPGLARQLACDSWITPVVLGAKSEVLDVGRRRRYATEAQRTAKLVETGGSCEVDGCDNPAGHFHHETRWADRHKTDLAHLLLLSPWHHNRSHSPPYTMTKLPTGKYSFHRRT
jgi:hypothetical protein